MSSPLAIDAGTITVAGRTAPRMGFGAMRLPGPGVWGPPADRDKAITVCRRAVELGVRVIDTAWYYGDNVSNEILAAALRPYPDDLMFITKLGGRRTSGGGWAAATRPEELREGCEHDLRALGVDSVPIAHLRWLGDGTQEVPFADALGAMTGLREAGKIERIGLSTVTLDQIEEAEQSIEIASVSNAYSPLDRADEAVVDHCTTRGIPYLPYFPLAMGNVADPGALTDVAGELGATPVQVALAWLLHRSPWMLPIPGTGDPEHLAENVAAGTLALDDATLVHLDAAGRPAGS